MLQRSKSVMELIAVMVMLLVLPPSIETRQAGSISNQHQQLHHQQLQQQQSFLQQVLEEDEEQTVDLRPESERGFFETFFANLKGGPQSVNFSACNDGTPAPTSLTVSCTDRIRDTCSLARGSNHTVSVRFTPVRSSSHVVSSVVSWRTWLEMPLPEQDRAACNYMSCPLEQGKETTFTYRLNMPDYVMRRRYSLIWRLTDVESNERVLCFSFRTHVT